MIPVWVAKKPNLAVVNHCRDLTLKVLKHTAVNRSTISVANQCDLYVRFRCNAVTTSNQSCIASLFS